MQKPAKPAKFNFEKLKAEATHPAIGVRMRAFSTYFEQFGEIPSYLFDNEREVDPMLLETVSALKKSESTSASLLKALDLLLNRLPSRL